MFEKENKKMDIPQHFPAIEKFNAFIAMLLKKWWLFAIVAILSGISGFIYASHQKTLYKSRLTFALDEAGSNNMGGFMTIASQFGISVGNGKDIFEGDNITEIMKSRRMIQKVLLSVDTFDNKPYTLIEYYLQKIKNNDREPAKNQLHFPVNENDSSFSYQQDSLLYNTYLEFSKKINAERPDRKLSIYEVNVTTADEKFTKDFTEKLLSATNNFYVEIRTRKAKETLEILERRVASMKGNLNSSIAGKATVQDVNVNPAFSEAQVPVQKQQSNIQVYGAAYAEMFKNLELARFQYLNEIPLMQIIDNANYPMQKIKTGKLKTAITWAIISCLFIIFIFWVIRIVNYEPNIISARE
jgi:subunit length determinant Wzz-like protein